MSIVAMTPSRRAMMQVGRLTGFFLLTEDAREDPADADAGSDRSMKERLRAFSRLDR
jgi:hypothetical protein